MRDGRAPWLIVVWRQTVNKNVVCLLNCQPSLWRSFPLNGYLHTDSFNMLSIVYLFPSLNTTLSSTTFVYKNKNNSWLKRDVNFISVRCGQAWLCKKWLLHTLYRINVLTDITHKLWWLYFLYCRQFKRANSHHRRGKADGRKEDGFIKECRQAGQE